jgi:hypothetical protein
MKKEHALEIKLRASKFDNSDMARAALRADALLPDFVYNLMIESGVLELQGDGHVVGCQRRPRKAAVPSADWGATWPRRQVILNLLDDGALTMTVLKNLLSQAGETTGHWAVIHALRKLMASGAIVKKGLAYQLASQGAVQTPITPAPVVKPRTKDDEFVAVWEKATPQAQAALLQAIKDVGTACDKVTVALRKHPTFREWAGPGDPYGYNFAQAFIDRVVARQSAPLET